MSNEVYRNLKSIQKRVFIDEYLNWRWSIFRWKIVGFIFAFFSNYFQSLAIIVSEKTYQNLSDWNQFSFRKRFEENNKKKF